MESEDSRTPEIEGVIKFDLQFTPAAPLAPDILRELNAWRRILFALGLLGQDPQRYGGIGFGNLSQRLDPQGLRFVITGTQSGHLATLDAHHYSIVNDCDPARNWLRASGPIAPSSESMTHGMLYALDPDLRFVFHVHAPDIWRRADTLGLPVTNPSVAYGTPAMAGEVQRLWERREAGAAGVIVMGGHEDGVIAYGQTAEAVGFGLVRVLARAMAEPDHGHE